MNEVDDHPSIQKDAFRNALTRCLLHSVIVLAIIAVTLFFFSPRFVYWTFLDSEAGTLGPEASRAQKILLQLEDPFAKIDDPSNVVIQWRLLFPLLGHFLELPPKLFLALPYLGCFLSLSLILVQARRATQSLLEASLITALASSCSWFFVSTGWLGYFDSFYILGLLLITFYKPRWILLLTCLLLPWVNERFIFGLPLAMTLRAHHCGHLNRDHYRTFVKDIVLAALVLVLFLLPRLLITKSNDSISGLLLNNFLYAANIRDFPEQVFQGSWHGLRLAWVGVFVFCFASFLRLNRVAFLFTLGIILFTSYAAVSMAGDISRSMSILLPAVVLGFIQFATSSSIPKVWRRIALTGLLCLNFTVPTKHVITTLETPIQAFPTEWENYRDPPLVLSPEKNLSLGKSAYDQGRFQTAFQALNWSIRLNPRYAEAYYWRAKILERSHAKWSLIERDYRRVIEHGKKNEAIVEAAERVLERHVKVNDSPKKTQ